MSEEVKIQFPSERVRKGATGHFYINTPNGERKCTSDGRIITRIRASKKDRKRLKASGSAVEIKPVD